MLAGLLGRRTKARKPLHQRGAAGLVSVSAKRPGKRCEGVGGGRVPVAGHKAFVPPSSAVEIWVGNGARGWGMRYSLELIVFVGAPTLGWFIFFG